MNSIQFNEHMFVFIGATLALTFIVYGLIQARKRPPDTPQKHWLAEEQAEQIIWSCWPEEVT